MWNLHFVKRVRIRRPEIREKGAVVLENVIRMIQ